MGVPCLLTLHGITAEILNLTPMWRKSASALGATHRARLRRAATEQAAAAALMSKLLDASALAYLRRRSPCERRRKGGKSFPLRLKKEKYGIPDGIPWLFRNKWKGQINLNLTPMWRKSASALGATHCARLRRAATEQAAAAALMSKLLDASALAYLRRRSPCERRRKGGKSFPLRLKKEKYGIPDGIPWLFRNKWKGQINLNLTPMWRKSASALGATHCARLRRAATEQLCSPR